MRGIAIQITVLIFFTLLGCTNCGSPNEMSDNASVNGEFHVYRLLLNGLPSELKTAYPWHQGFRHDQGGTRQYLVDTALGSFLVHPRSYSHGLLIALNVFPQADCPQPLTVISYSVQVETVSGIERPVQTDTLGPSIRHDLPFLTTKPFFFTSLFPSQHVGPDHQAWTFRLTLGDGERKESIELYASRLGDSLRKEATTFSRGGVWGGLQYLLD